MQYRLWDIDKLINRTLVYGFLTVLLVIIYIVIITSMQWILNSLTKQSFSLALILSTSAIAILFNPLRNIIQEHIARLFYHN